MGVIESSGVFGKISMTLRDYDRLEWNLVFVNVCKPNKAVCAVLLHRVTYQGHFAQVKVV